MGIEFNQKSGSQHPPRPPHGVHGKSFGVRLCRVLHLDEDQVKSITLHVDSDNVVTMDVTFMLHPEDADGLVDLVSRYHLIEEDKR